MTGLVLVTGVVSPSGVGVGVGVGVGDGDAVGDGVGVGVGEMTFRLPSASATTACRNNNLNCRAVLAFGVPLIRLFGMSLFTGRPGKTFPI